MILSIIVAVDLKYGIGYNNSLLWHLPDDFKRFKKLTMGKPVIMGRKTYQSIGKPLPGRLNIVISKNFHSEGITVLDSLQSALEYAQKTGCEEAFIIGGGIVYKQALPITDRVYLTKVETTIEADTFFEFDPSEDWEETYREHHSADAKHQFAFNFIDYERISN